MRTILLIFALFLFQPGVQASETISEKSEWFTCQKDDDCVDIKYPCAGATVNKKFLEEANKVYRYQNSIRDCFIPPKDEKNLPPFKVFCREGKCGKQGKNPKMGFS